MITDERIVADSSEPKSIAELNNHAVYAAGAVKGKDSVIVQLCNRLRLATISDNALICYHLADALR